MEEAGKQDIVVTVVEEEVITTQEERVARGLSQVLLQRFHRFVTRGAEAAGSEADLVEVEFTDEEVEVTHVRIPSPPQGEQQQLPARQPLHADPF